jgi:hypothetical protein
MSDEIKVGVLHAEAKAYAMANPGITPAQIRQLFPTVTPTQSRNMACKSKQAATRAYREEANRKRLKNLAAQSAAKKAAALEYAKANPSVGLKEIGQKFNCCVKHISTWKSAESKRRSRKSVREFVEIAAVSRESGQGIASRGKARPLRKKWCAIVNGEPVDPRAVSDVKQIESFRLVMV